MTRSEKLTTYYQERRDGDLKASIRALRQKRGSRFEGRSENEILRLLLVEKLSEVLEQEGIKVSSDVGLRAQPAKAVSS
jgi:hypothetical protein